MSMPDFAKEPWLHPAVASKHVVSHTRCLVRGVPHNEATCQCGWFARETVEDARERWLGAKQHGTDPRDDAVYAHWRDVIAKAEASPT